MTASREDADVETSSDAYARRFAGSVGAYFLKVQAEATLELPADTSARTGGRNGRHSEEMGPLLAEMQYLYRSYPGASW